MYKHHMWFKGNGWHYIELCVLIYSTVTTRIVIYGLHRPHVAKPENSVWTSQKRRIVFRCGMHAFDTLTFYNQWNLRRVTWLVQKGWNEELLFDLTSCRVCILSGIGLNEKKKDCYFCDPAECCFLMLSAPHSFYAYPTLEVKFLLAAGSLQKRRISQHFSLSLSVIRNRLCLLAFSKTKRRSIALSFLPHLMVISLWLICRCGCVAHCLGKCV